MKFLLVLCKGQGILLTAGGNAASGALNSYITEKSSVYQGAIGSGIGSVIGYGFGKAIEIPLSKKYPDLTWLKYNPQPLNDKVPYVYGYKKTIVPSVSGTMTGELGNRVFQGYYSKQEGGK